MVINFYRQGWKEMPEFEPTDLAPDVIGFSVIIPARNEEANIGRLLHSLHQQTYPRKKFEIIVIDDHSTDNTANIVQHFNEVKLLRLKEDKINSYKKKAIETAIAHASNEWIVCTDADCIANKNWLWSIAQCIKEKNSVFIAAPVALIPTNKTSGNKLSLLHIFQALDFLTLQGITGASVFRKKHSMCNGANLAYRKDIFFEVDGFKGIDKIASGDDMLLMHKIAKQYPNRIHFLKSKSAIIETNDAPNWKAFINQRIRWASKATDYDDKRIFAVLFLVYLYNFSFLVLLIAGFFKVQFLLALLVMIVLKTLVEFSFVKSVSYFFNRTHLLKFFPFFQPLHIAYTIIAGLLGSIGKYEWKGRRVK